MREEGASPDKRERILRAAVEAFSRRGFYRTRIRDIAQAAGVADGTVYLYYENKEDLLTAIYEDVMARFFKEGRRRLAEPGSAPERLRRLIELHLSSLGEDRDLATVFQIELRHTGHGMERYSRSHLHDYFGMIEEILLAGQAEGTMRKDINTWFAARSIFGVIDEAATDWVLSSREARLGEQVEAVLDFLLNGIACAEPLDGDDGAQN